MILEGENFPDDPATPFYCSLGADLGDEYISATVRAIVIDANHVKCPNLNDFCTDKEFTGVQASLYFGYNDQDYIVSASLFVYPAIRIERLLTYFYTPY